jgi:hypothetical protein
MIAVFQSSGISHELKDALNIINILRIAMATNGIATAAASRFPGYSGRKPGTG